MGDRREEILARIVVVLEGLTVDGAPLTVLRNPTDIPEHLRPLAIVYDGSEALVQPGNNQPLKAARSVMQMKPAVLARARKTAADAGTAVNDLRAPVLKAIMTDAVLWALTYNKRSVTHDGGETSLGRGMAVEADIALDFSIDYLLDFDTL